MSDGDHLVERGPDWRWLGGGAVVLGLLAVALGLAAGDDGEPSPEVTATPTTISAPATTTTPPTTPPPPTTGVDRTRVDPTWPTEPAVSLRGGVPALGGRIALAPRPDATDGTGGLDDEPLWVVDGGRSIGRFDLPTRPGDWRYPVLFGAGGVAVVDDEANVALMSLDGSELTTLPLDDPVRYLVPAATTGALWAVHDDAELTFVAADGTTSPVATPDDVGRIVAGVADGVLAWSSDEEWDFPRYVAEGAAPVELTAVTDPQSSLIGSSGDLLAAFAPGPQVVVVDVRSDELVAAIPVVRNATLACFSADRSHLAIRDRAGNGPLAIVDLTSGRRLARWPDHRFGDMAWASETELVIVDGARLVRFDADGGGEGIGLVTGPTRRPGTSATAWWVASERAPC